MQFRKNNPVSAGQAKIDQDIATAEDAHPGFNSHTRQRAFTLLALLVFLVAAAGLSYGAIIGSAHRITTDNAYVNAELAQVTPLVSGAVADIKVKDTQFVHEGDVLVVLDDKDLRLSVARAEAHFWQAQRRVRGYFANDLALGAVIASREAALTSAGADLAHIEREYARRQNLARDNAISKEELAVAGNRVDQATAALSVAQAQLELARADRDANRALIDDTTLQNHPEIKAAEVQLQQAEWNLERSVIRAPLDGLIAKRSVQIGQRVQAGATLMNIVPLHEVFVSANFKEVQLKDVKVGQAVTLKADLYGDQYIYNGKVAGIAGGTGAAFAIIPAQNATGNWIKVVQRLPVRIEIDPNQLRQRPLRIGLSMETTIHLEK
ncbi:HlyD family efflux transporter periplasmic adaptor subunit [Ketobacter sp. MCCC 1A13808]|uniref:HlyD family efflux transporter periplasmic adaptor subunit n=1 Tax=Ketobacter sp. MCCC 1A13808 TaxID=2602738 RepID=UPI0012EB3A30|nr:HlyD family efflux transporter periplasmic adaptor subunit [Ketobacter sp. MCCC 1A13808]MVF10808.1 HlyD family efflux transporter periplasmic adaptor subunit [Ketobacter sp. MCCC 1A13808]